MSTKRTFVRGLWGDDHVERWPLALQHAKSNLRKNLQPEPCLVYCYGAENAEFLRRLGVESIVLSERPVVSFGGETERRPGPRGVVNYGAAMWRHKVEMIRRALANHDEVVWLDWDCMMLEPLPGDFWEKHAAGKSFRLSLLKFLGAPAFWRARNQRCFVCDGSFVYCRDRSYMDAIANLYEKHPCEIDQTLFAMHIDERWGGWKGIEAYRTDGWSLPYHASQHSKRVHEPEATVFRTRTAKVLKGNRKRTLEEEWSIGRSEKTEASEDQHG